MGQRQQQTLYSHGTEENLFQSRERNRHKAIRPEGEARTVYGMRNTAWEGQKPKRPQSQDSETWCLLEKKV